MGAVALGAALAAHGRPAPDQIEHVRSLRDRLLGGILELDAHAERNGAGADLPNTFSVWLPGRSSLKLQHDLGEVGLSVTAQVARSASAPTTWDHAPPATDLVDASVLPSHVLRAMGASPERASESLRFSLGTMTSAAEVDRALEILRSTLPSSGPSPGRAAGVDSNHHTDPNQAGAPARASHPFSP